MDAHLHHLVVDLHILRAISAVFYIIPTISLSTASSCENWGRSNIELLRRWRCYSQPLASFAERAEPKARAVQWY